MSIFNLPDLGEGLAEAEIHEWHVKEGDMVLVDQPLVSVETAKAVVEVPAPQAGRIVKLYGKAGDMIKTNAPLVEFAEEDKGTVVGRLEVSQVLLDEGGAVKSDSAKVAEKAVKAMPAVRALARELHVDLNHVKPTGLQGQITEDDVKQSSGDVLHGVRYAMAMAMEKSHQEIVPVTVFDEADVTAWGSESDITVRLIQAMVDGINAEPLMNAWFDGKTHQYRLQKDIHLGLAMDTVDGLFVPVLRDVAKKSANELRDMINQFKKSVRDRTIMPRDLQGATITLSNFGTIAGEYTTPIILPPMVAILASGKMREVVRVHEGVVAIRRVIPLSLTFDHRVLTGGEATRFFGAVIDSLSSSSASFTSSRIGDN